MAENVQIEFGANTAKADSGIEAVKSRLSSLSEVASKAFEANQIIEFGDKLVELGRKALEFAEHFTQMGEQINRATQMLGLSASDFQDFAFSVKLSGGSMDGAIQSLIRLEKNIGDAARGAGDALPFFKAVGVSLDDLKNGNLDQILAQIADRFSETKDGVEKTTIALNIGGRSFAQMIPTLNEGSEGLAELRDRFAETGSKLSDLQKDAFQKTDDTLKILETSFEGLGVTIFDAFRPAIDSAVSIITSLVQGFNDAIKEGGEWRAVLQALIIVIDGIVGSIDLFITAVKTLGSTTSIVLGALMDGWFTFGQVMGDVLSGNWSQIETHYNEGLARIEKNTNDKLAKMSKDWEEFRKRTAERGAGAAGGVPTTGGDKSKKDSLILPGDTTAAKDAAAERLKIATDEIETAKRLRQLDLENEKDILAKAVDANMITAEQKIAVLMHLANESYQIEKEALDKELQLDGLKASQKAQLNSQLLILERKHQYDIAQIQRQAQAQEVARYKQVFGAIGTSFKGMLQGMLQGTQTWQQTMNNFFVNILSSFVEMLAEMVLHWIETQVMMAIFGQTETAAIISGHAAEGAAAAYASTAAIPIVGPELAPGAAALAYSSIMAYKALPSFDVGAWQLGSDGVAMVHQDEMIVPAGPAQAFRDALSGQGGSGGGGDMFGSSQPDVHLHLHAMDGQSAGKFLMNNRDAIAAALRSAMRGGNAHLSTMMKA